MTTDFEMYKDCLAEYLETITEESRGKNQYICPICDSGNGKHHTGAFTFYPDSQSWYCFSCNQGGDIYDLIGAVEGIPDKGEQLKRAREIFGYDGETMTSTPKHSGKSTGKAKHGKYTDYLKRCQKNLNSTDYLSFRGISFETAEKMGIGFDPALFSRGGITIPTSNDGSSYAMRNIDTQSENRYLKSKDDEGGFFNVQALETAKESIYIVEGYFDALSIIEAGGQAIALGGTGFNKLIKLLKRNPPKQTLIVSMDNDDAGQTAQIKLLSKLRELNISCVGFLPYSGNIKDANEALTRDRKSFMQAVEHGKTLEDDVLRAKRESYLKNATSNHIQNFLNGIRDSASTPKIITGFKKLDKALDGGLYEGVYTIGAISSLGKTTLAMQMMDQIAQQGHDVLIFSLEMARTQLMAKSISRHTVINAINEGIATNNAKSSRGITDGGRYVNYSQTEKQLINKSVLSYAEYSNHIYISEGVGDIGVNEIRQTTETHIRFMKNKPVVLIDYLQILSPYDVKASDKQNMDKAMVELKRISRDNKIPIIVISSFNRENYKEKVTMKAFKESGSIEYSSDVLIGLQLRGAGQKGFDETQEKNKDPRQVELVILKNREGKTGEKVSFEYYPVFNYFKEK